MPKEQRTLFLKEFTKTLILNSESDKEVPLSHHPVKYQPSFIPMELSISSPQQQLIPPETVREMMSSLVQKKHQTLVMIPKQRFQPTTRAPQIKQQQTIQPMQRMIIPKTQEMDARMRNPYISSIAPAPQPLPLGFTLGKIDPLIRDQKLTTIECTGPNKPLLVKIINKVTPTQITLNEQEIRNIAESFSKAAKIPIIEGIFKAAVGNLVITAVLSNFVGSRFIINKYTPYSLISEQY